MSELTTRTNPSSGPAAAGGAHNHIARLAEAFGPIDKLVDRRDSTRVNVALASMRRLDLGEVDEARRRLKLFPSREALEADLHAIREAIEQPADDDQVRFIVAAMLDAIPAARSVVTATLIDAAVLAIRNAEHEYDGYTAKAPGISAPVMFFTFRRIVARFRFAPSIAEVLEIAREERERVIRALKATVKIAELRDDAEHVVSIAEADLSGWDEHFEGDA